MRVGSVRSRGRAVAALRSRQPKCRTWEFDPAAYDCQEVRPSPLGEPVPSPQARNRDRPCPARRSSGSTAVDHRRTRRPRTGRTGTRPSPPGPLHRCHHRVKQPPGGRRRSRSQRSLHLPHRLDRHSRAHHRHRGHPHPDHRQADRPGPPRQYLNPRSRESDDTDRGHAHPRIGKPAGQRRLTNRIVRAWVSANPVARPSAPGVLIASRSPEGQTSAPWQRGRSARRLRPEGAAP